MYKSPSHLPEEARAKIADVLNARLADGLDLHSQIKVAHWNIKGPQFAALHPLFETFAVSLASFNDAIAERAVPALMLALADPRDSARDMAVLGLAAAGEVAVPALAEVLTGYDQRVAEVGREAGQFRVHQRLELWDLLEREDHDDEPQRRSQQKEVHQLRGREDDPSPGADVHRGDPSVVDVGRLRGGAVPALAVGHGLSGVQRG